MKLTYLLLLLSALCIVSVHASDTPHPIFWERVFTMNITNAIKNNRGTLIESTGVMSVSQDFQAIQSDRNPAYPPHVK